MHHLATATATATTAPTQDWTTGSILTLLLGLALTIALGAAFIVISGRWK